MASITSDVKGFKTYQAKKIVEDATDVWIAVGKTTPWGSTDHNNVETVPTVQHNEALQELVAMKRAQVVSYVLPSEEGEIEQLGQNWKKVSIEEARQNDCKWVYVSTWLDYDNFPVVTYRQTGIYIDLVLNEGVEPNKQVITEENIKDKGFLVVVNNRSPITRDATQKELVEFIIQL